MEAYPRTLVEFEKQFATEKACRLYLGQLRWPDGFVKCHRRVKVASWRTSDQKHRWLAAALLDIAPRLRRLRGHRSLSPLRSALQREIQGQEHRAAHRAA